MAKFTKASEDIEAIVNDVAQEIGLTNFMEFEALHMPKAKDVVTVTKASALAEYLSKREDLVLVIVREDAFDLVDEDTKKLWIRMAMDSVSYDSEKDRITIGVPSITIPVGFYERYKEKAIESALLARYTLSQIEDAEKQRKAEQAGKKKKGD